MGAPAYLISGSKAAGAQKNHRSCTQEAENQEKKKTRSKTNKILTPAKDVENAVALLTGPNGFCTRSQLPLKL